MAGGGGALRAFFEGAQEDTAQAVEDSSEKIASTLGDDAAANVRASVTTHDNANAANLDLIDGIGGKAGTLPDDGAGAGGPNKIDNLLNGKDEGGAGTSDPYLRQPAGAPDGAGGQFAPKDPDAPPREHTRGTEYPSSYSKATHDYMNQNFRDANGNWRDESGKLIRDKDGNLVTDKDLTYDHVPPVVDHWNDEGRYSPYADRAAWYDDPSHLRPMSRWENSRLGGMMEQRYKQDTGPNYTRRGDK